MKGNRSSDPLYVAIASGGAGSGGTSSTDEAPFIEGATGGTPAMGAVSDSPAADAAEDSLAILRLTGARAAHVNLRKADGTEVDMSALLDALRDALRGADARTLTHIYNVLAGTLAVAGTVAVANFPADPATATRQDTGNASLATIAGKDFATQTTLGLVKAKTDNLDIAISALRDAIIGAGPKTITDLANLLAGGLPAALDSGALKVREQKRLVSFDTPTRATVAGMAANIVAAGTAGAYRRILVSVRANADTGIYVNANGAATTSHFLIPPGGIRVFETDQAISAIRAGSADVTVDIEVAT